MQRSRKPCRNPPGLTRPAEPPWSPQPLQAIPHTVPWSLPAAGASTHPAWRPSSLWISPPPERSHVVTAQDPLQGTNTPDKEELRYDSASCSDRECVQGLLQERHTAMEAAGSSILHPNEHTHVKVYSLWREDLAQQQVLAVCSPEGGGEGLAQEEWADGHGFPIPPLGMLRGFPSACPHPPQLCPANTLKAGQICSSAPNHSPKATAGPKLLEKNPARPKPRGS